MSYSGFAEMIVPMIFITAGVCLCLLIVSFVCAKNIEKKIRADSEKDFKNSVYIFSDTVYTLFVTLVSLFPLLGMLGTVLALLGMNVSGTTDDLKNNFFQALDTTMWGIVFSLVFKFVNAVLQPYIELQIEKAKECLRSASDSIKHRR